MKKKQKAAFSWNLPALVDRRRKPRSANASARQKALARKRRRNPS